MQLSLNLFDPKYLFASLIWSSVGLGYFIYGKKQQEIFPLLAGLAMIAISFFVASALFMSIICLALMAAVYFLMKR